jgi:hypothetical protein
MTVSDARIVIHFDVHEPIELVELTLSLNALAKQYKSFLLNDHRTLGRKITEADVKLYVTKIENNCILCELGGASEVLGTLMPILEYSKTFVDFLKTIVTAVEWFKKIGKSGEPPKGIIPYSKKDCADFSHFLNLVASKKQGELGLSSLEYENEDAVGAVRFKAVFTNSDALDGRRGALITERALDLKGEADYTHVVMQLFQTNTDPSKHDGKTSERAIITRITPKDLPVYFISDLDRERVNYLKQDPKVNPFKSSYHVDVSVETDRKGSPVFYRVVRVHDIVPDNE